MSRDEESRTRCFAGDMILFFSDVEATCGRFVVGLLLEDRLLRSHFVPVFERGVRVCRNIVFEREAREHHVPSSTYVADDLSESVLNLSSISTGSPPSVRDTTMLPPEESEIDTMEEDELYLFGGVGVGV